MSTSQNCTNREINSIFEKTDRILLYAIIFELIFLLLFSQLGSEEIYMQIFSSTALTLLIAITFLITRIFSKPTDENEFLPVTFPFLTAFILFLFVSSTLSVYKYGSFLELLKFGNAVILIFIVMRLSVGKKTVTESIIKSVMFLGIFSAIIGVLSFFSVTFFPEAEISRFVVSHNFVLNGRVGSLMQYPNTYGAFLTITFIFLTYFIVNKKLNKPLQISFYVAGIIVLYSLYLTRSIGASLFSFLPGTILMIVFTKKRKVLLSTLGITFLGALILIIVNKAVVVPIITNSSFQNKDFASLFLGKNGLSIPARIQFIKDSIKIFLKRPFFGFGLGTFKYEIVKVRPYGGFYSILPHSSLLMFLSGSGIFATVAFVLITVSSLSKSFKTSLKEPLLGAIYAATISLLLHSFVDIDFLYPFIVIVTFLLLAFLTNVKPITMKKNMIKAIKSVTLALLLFVFLLVIPKTVSSVYGFSGKQKLSEGNLIKAAYSYIAALKHDFKNDTYHYRLASIYRELSFSKTFSCDNPITFKELKEAINLNPANFNYPETYGILELALKNKESIEYFNKTIQLNPTDPNIFALKSLALIYTTKSKKEAEEIAKEVLNYYPKNSIALTTIGFCDLPHSTSLLYFNKAIQTDKYNSFSYLGKALYFKNIGNTEKELENLFKLTRISHCLKEGWNMYLKTTPVIKINSCNINNSRLFLSWTISGNNKNIIKYLEITINSQNGSRIGIFRINGNTNSLTTHIQNKTNTIRIIITAFDNSNLPISEVISGKIKNNN